MRELGRRFTAAQPDSVVCFTPHNVHLERAMAVITAARLSGALEEAPALIHLTVPSDRELALEIVARLRARRVPVNGVSYGGNDPREAMMPLDWGTLIPLWFMGGRSTPPLKTVVMAPARDLSPQQHVQAGAAVGEAIAASGKRVAVIASADHGHGHRADGPYGFSAESAAFDAQVLDHLRRNDLAAIAGMDEAFVQAAKADSWWQMLLLYGALGDGWRVDVLSYEAPTYYGMLCATLTPS
jgi:aromatic ring-opening dioxygenase LigB subunit